MSRNRSNHSWVFIANFYLNLKFRNHFFQVVKATSTMEKTEFIPVNHRSKILLYKETTKAKFILTRLCSKFFSMKRFIDLCTVTSYILITRNESWCFKIHLNNETFIFRFKLLLGCSFYRKSYQTSKVSFSFLSLSQIGRNLYSEQNEFIREPNFKF